MEYYSEIETGAREMLGTVENENVFQIICMAAAEELEQRLRKGITPGNCRYSFIPAACLLTVAGYRKAMNEVERFDAGGVSMTFREGADALVQLAYRMISPWSKGEIGFRGVRA